MTYKERLVFTLGAAGWSLLISPHSSWVVVKRHGHIIAGDSLSNVAVRAAQVTEGRNAS